MMNSFPLDAVVVGAGPNGLSAAIHLARSGYSVQVFEGAEKVGGGSRSEALTLPGYIHDVCSAIHPLGVASPFFQTLPLDQYGLEWIHPVAPVAHPLDDGTAVVLSRDMKVTAENLGEDSRSYERWMRPFVRNYKGLLGDILGPLRIPRHPVIMARFGLHAIRSAKGLFRSNFKDPRTAALLAGLAGHSMLPLDRRPTASVALVELILGHAVGWPLAKGGSQAIGEALAAYLHDLGGEIHTGRWISSLSDIPQSSAVVFDLTPRQILELEGCFIPTSLRSQLSRFRYGAGIFKVDWALSGPIPWTAESCLDAATVHLGGSFEQIAESEQAVWEGVHPERPFVLLAQQSLFDPSRAPAGKHTAWGYCHVPSGSQVDMTDRIEAQIERFAPGFAERIIHRSTRNSVGYEAYNPNYIGGDINGGVQDLRQLFTRPTPRLDPYRLPGTPYFICSSSTPPGGGVHGMCGYFAAKSAIKFLKKRR